MAGAPITRYFLARFALAVTLTLIVISSLGSAVRYFKEQMLRKSLHREVAAHRQTLIVLREQQARLDQNIRTMRATAERMMQAHPENAARWAEVLRVIEGIEKENEMNCHEKLRQIEMGVQILVQISARL